MEDFIKIFLPIYFIFYFAIAFVIKTLLVAKKIGKNPLVLPKDDTAYGLVGLYFKLLMVLLFVYVVVYAVFPDWYEYCLSITQFENDIARYIGLTLLIFSLVWTIVAQNNMRTSWRIGIDTQTKTELITTGLFTVSRNPIFFGMIVSLVGLFLLTPNGLTTLIMILGYVLIQIQVRLEEEYLLNLHGETYRNYFVKVKRWI